MKRIFATMRSKRLLIAGALAASAPFVQAQGIEVKLSGQVNRGLLFVDDYRVGGFTAIATGGHSHRGEEGQQEGAGRHKVSRVGVGRGMREGEDLAPAKGACQCRCCPKRA